MSNVPKLRFPEFSGEWGKKKLGEITNKTGEKYKNQKEYGVYSISNKYGFILQEEQFEGGRLGGLDKALYQIVNPGEFAYNPARINVGSIALLENEECGIVSSLYVCFKLTPEIGNLFFKQYIKTYAFRVSVLRNTEGSVREYLFYDNLSNIALFFPDAVEQTKIANFLTHLDKKITKQDEKVGALEHYKKGLMHKIFSREIRFKDEYEKDYPEWEKVSLGSMGVTYGGLNAKSKNDFGVGDSKYITYLNVFFNPITSKTMVEKVNVGKGEKQNKVNHGDILFTASSETPEEVGMSSVWLHGVDDVYLNSFCFGYRLIKKETFNLMFLAYSLRSPGTRNIISMLAQGSTRFNMSKSALMKIEIEKPSLPEQTKIATFLSLYDRKIEKEKAKLRALREQKKGLLQQMFV